SASGSSTVAHLAGRSALWAPMRVAISSSSASAVATNATRAASGGTSCSARVLLPERAPPRMSVRLRDMQTHEVKDAADINMPAEVIGNGIERLILRGWRRTEVDGYALPARELRQHGAPHVGALEYAMQVSPSASPRRGDDRGGGGLAVVNLVP